jgi:hypothetical protein
MHIHAYVEKEASPKNQPVKDRLRRKPTATFDGVEQAVDWHRKWIEDNPRPTSSWFLHDTEEQGKHAKAEFTRRSFEHGNDVIDFFWLGQHVMLLMIPCPPRVIPGFPEPPPCPQGRH